MKRFLAVIIVVMMFVSGCTVKVPDTPIATETAQATATHEPTAVPTATPTVTPTVAPTATPTASPTPTVTPTPVPTEIPTATPAPTPTPISDLTTVLPDGNTIADVLWYVSEDNAENARLRGTSSSDECKGKIYVLSNVYVSNSDGTVVDYTDTIRNAEVRTSLPTNEYEREYQELNSKKSLINIIINSQSVEFVIEAYMIYTSLDNIDEDLICGMYFMPKIDEDATGAAYDYAFFFTDPTGHSPYAYKGNLQILYSLDCINNGDRLFIKKIRAALPASFLREKLNDYGIYPLMQLVIGGMRNDFAIIFRKE